MLTFYLPAQDAKVSIVDVRDIAAVAVKVLTNNNRTGMHHNKAYLITGPEAISYHHAAEILTTVTGRKVDYVSISDEEARGGMKEANMGDWLINTILELYDYYRKGNASYVSSAVEEVIGRKPITFAQFANEYAEAFR